MLNLTVIRYSLCHFKTINTHWPAGMPFPKVIIYALGCERLKNIHRIGLTHYILVIKVQRSGFTLFCPTLVKVILQGNLEGEFLLIRHKCYLGFRVDLLVFGKSSVWTSFTSHGRLVVWSDLVLTSYIQSQTNCEIITFCIFSDHYWIPWLSNRRRHCDLFCLIEDNRVGFGHVNWQQ